MNMNKNQFVKGVLIGAYVAVIFAVVITVAGELYQVAGEGGKVLKPIKDTLAGWHGHHWVGKSIWTVIVFLVTSAGAYLVNRKELDFSGVSSHARVLMYTLILGTVAIYGFFGYEYLIH